MFTHTDMSYVKEYREKKPKLRELSDPVAYAPFSSDGTPQRLQSVLCLNESNCGWFGYSKGHKYYKEIGDAIGWPGP
eukprot:UN05949